MRITFDVIKYRARRKENGKWRQKTFEQTVNPFNTNANGTVRTRQEVFERVRELAKEWENETLKGHQEDN